MNCLGDHYIIYLDDCFIADGSLIDNDVFLLLTSLNGNSLKCAPKYPDPEPGHYHLGDPKKFLIEIRPKSKACPGFPYNAVTIFL